MGLLRRFHLNNVVGNFGEDEAVTYLRSLGYRILDRNYRNLKGKALGELDIVAQDGQELVFVEVKARTYSDGQGEPLPEESITREKLRRLSRIAEGYIREHGKELVSYRFDAVLITIEKISLRQDIRHFKSIYL